MDDNDAVNDQIPKRERTSEAGYGRGGGSGLDPPLFRGLNPTMLERRYWTAGVGLTFTK